MASLFHYSAVHRALSFQDAHIGKPVPEVLLPFTCHIHLVSGIIGAGNQVVLLTAVRFFHKHRLLILTLHKRRFYHVNALLHMQLSWPALRKPVIVIDPVCNVTALLCLQNQGSSLDCMDAPGIDLKEIPFLNRHLPYELRPSALLNHGPQFFLVLCMVADDNGSVLVTVQDIPAFHLPKGTILMLCRIGVVRVDLDT